MTYLATGTWLNRDCIGCVFQDDILSILGFMSIKDSSLFRTFKAYSFSFLCSFSTESEDIAVCLYIRALISLE